MDREEIKNILPHREPMLLLDYAFLENGISNGRYTVRGDEFFLQGHFPGNPVVPGVMLCEMMAQSSCLLLDISQRKCTPYFTGLNNVKFKKQIKPGDTLEFKSELIKSKGIFYKIKSAGYVNGELCVSGEISVALVGEN